MLRLHRALLLLMVVAVVSGCGGSQGERVNLEPPRESTTLGPGDTFHMEIVGEKELPVEYQVAADGTATLPYIHTLKVAGLEPQEVAALVRQRLIAEKFLTNPSVVISVTEYRSKVVTLLGQVQKPGSFALAPEMTLLQAVSMAGGLTAIAHTTKVNLTRSEGDGTRTVVVNIEEIYEGRSPDIRLQAGDRIYVHERVF